MRSPKIDQKTYVALRYKCAEDVRDTHGNLTGEKVVKYYPAFTFKADISGAKGGVLIQVFGTDTNYDKTMVLSRHMFEKLKFDDNTVFFIDKKPEYKNGLPLYDYRVHKIADTTNEVVIAIKKVDKK